MRLRSLISLLAVLVLLAAALLVPATASAAPPPGPVTYVTARAGLRLRVGAGLSFSVVTTLRYGERVHVMGGPVYNQGISWSYVGVNRWGHYYEGYCATAYLGSYGGYVHTPDHGLKVVAAGGLRLRSGPGLWYATRRIVPYGAIVQPTGITAWGSGILWTKVKVNGAYLWAARSYLLPV